MRLLNLLIAAIFAGGLIFAAGPTPRLASAATVDNGTYTCDYWGLLGAITDATAGDTISFDCDPSSISFEESGAIHITKDLTIDGSNGDGPQITLNGEERSSFFIVDAGANLTVTNLEFFDGQSRDAGAIAVNSGGTLTATNVAFINNNAALGSGGAIYNVGSTTISQSTFTNNIAADNGGAIYNIGTLDIGQSSFTENVSCSGSSLCSGGAIHTENTTTIAQCIFTRNSSAGFGGAIFSHEAQISVTGSTFEQNHADENGGAINFDSSVSDTHVSLVAQSSFLNNSATRGGAIVAWANNINILASTMIGNTAASGSAFFYPNSHNNVRIAWSTIIQSSEQPQPAIFLNGGSIALEGIILGGPGNHCEFETAGASVEDSNTLANDTSCNLDGPGSEQDISDLGLSSPTSTVINGVEQTYVPLVPGSPAVDRGPTNCDTDMLDGPDPDQLGNPRPSGGYCDIGAIETNLRADRLCANTWNGAVRLDVECGRSELIYKLPQDAPITLCVNTWNAATRVAGQCSRSERIVTLTGDQTILVCVNTWNDILRATTQCTRSEIPLWL